MQGLAKLTKIEAKVLFLRDPVWLLVALAVPIGILLVFGLPGFARDPAPELGTVGVAGLAAGWMLWMVTLHPTWTRRRRLMELYCAGLLVLIGVLVVRSPWYGLFALTGYLHTYEFLVGRWRVVGVTATAALQSSPSSAGGSPTRTCRRWPPTCSWWP